MRVTFFIPGRPIGKGRPRLVSSRHVITPQRTREYETYVKRIVHYAMQGHEPAAQDEPVGVTLIARYPVPKSASKAMRIRLLDRGWYVCMPDLDNIVKAVLDGMRECWNDDRQVCSLRAEKLYAAEDEQVGCMVTVENLANRRVEHNYENP